MANRDGKGDVARTPHASDPSPPSPVHPAFVASPTHPAYPRILPFSEKAMRISFGQILRAARLRLALSQEELAARAGMYRTNISLLEAGRRNVRVVTVCILAHALRINPGELMPILFQPDSTPVVHKALPISKPRPSARPAPPAHL